MSFYNSSEWFLRPAVESGSDRAAKHACGQSAVRSVSTHDGGGERDERQ